MKKLHNFNYEKAIDIQCSQLSQWAKSGINPNVFKELLDKVSDCNASAFKTQNAFDVIRGENIAIILNDIINNQHTN
jgi:hypothetical protein